jgi:hypothetical protein
MRIHLPTLGLAAFVLVSGAAPARAQSAQADETTRTAVIEHEQDEKSKQLHPYVPGTAERYLDFAETVLTNRDIRWHPFFNNAYAGGGFTLGAGHISHFGSYNTLDVRGTVTFLGYLRLESEVIVPRLFGRRGTLSLLGGWRKATQVGFYGIGADTSKDNRANYGFQQPYGSATLEVRAHRNPLMVRGGFEVSQWQQKPGSGSDPSVETIYTPSTLPGLGTSPTYLHSQGTIGLDTRTSPGYTRRGGFYGVTFHDFSDTNSLYGFTQVDYEAIQHFPILREAWVVSLHGRVETTGTKDNQQIPFFMLPSNGGGSDLRAYSSWRFRDRNSLLVQAEWRIMVNRFFDTAVFFDAGKVTAHASDLDLSDLKTDAGFGIRFHGPMATPLRVDFAHGNEGLGIVFSASAVF